jgi:hypothetical protein
VPAETRFVVRLTPRGGTDRLEGVGEDGVLRARVAAPPVDDAANRALIRLLAGELGVATARVSIVGGVSARRKTVAVEGIPPEAILARWPGLRL